MSNEEKYKQIHLYDLLVYIIDEKNNKVESVFMPEILSEDNPEVIETPVKLIKMESRLINNE